MININKKDFYDTIYPGGQLYINKKLKNIDEQAKKEKLCYTCSNAYPKIWNNNGIEDILFICSINKKCVQYQNGLDCNNYSIKDQYK